MWQSRFPIGPVPAILALATLLGGSPAGAGVRAPAGDTAGIPCDPWLRSTLELEAPPAGCQYRFAVDGGLDELVVIVTLRDCFDTPIPGCDVVATLEPALDNPNFCACEPVAQMTQTDAVGAAEFRYSRIGGRGAAGVTIAFLCWSPFDTRVLGFDFTSPDLNGSCESGSATTIIDLGIWSAGLQFYEWTSDYNCDLEVGILDLAIWASGLGVGCP